MGKPIFTACPDVFALAREESDRIRMSQVAGRMNNLSSENQRLLERVEELSNYNKEYDKLFTNAVNYFNAASENLYSITSADQTPESLADSYIHKSMATFAYQTLYASMGMKDGKLSVPWNINSARQYNLMMISAYYCYQMLESLPTKIRQWYSRWDSLCQGMTEEEKTKCLASFSEVNNSALKFFGNKTIRQTIISVTKLLMGKAEFDSESDVWPSYKTFDPMKLDYCIDVSQLINHVFKKECEPGKYKFLAGQMPSSLEMVLTPQFLTPNSIYAMPPLLRNDNKTQRAIPFSADVVSKMKQKP